MDKEAYRVFHDQVEAGQIEDGLFLQAAALRLSQELKGEQLENHARCWRGGGLASACWKDWCA